MGKNSLRLVKNGLLFVLLMSVLACGGNCEDDENAAPTPGFAWSVQVPSPVSGPPGGSAAFDIEISRSTPTPFDLDLSTETSTPGWTASLSHSTARLTTPALVVRMTVNVPATAAAGSTAVFRLRSARTLTDIKWTNITVTVGSSSTTSITKVSDFAAEADGVFVSRFRVENGAPHALIGSLNFQFAPNIRYWYRPDNTLNLDVNQSKDYELVAIPLDSVQAAGNQSVTGRFDKLGVTYSYSSTFNLAGNNDRGFRILEIKGSLNRNVVGDKARYQITIDLPIGKAGVYTPTVDRLHGTLEANFMPPSKTFGASGGSATFELVITRLDPHGSQGFMPYEPVLVGTHDSKPECNIRQVFPIFSE